MNLKQNLSVTEITAALRMGRLAPVSTSPLAGLAGDQNITSATTQALAARGISNGSALLPEWRRAFSTLADPQQQATAYIERAGAAQYFGGVGGVASIVPLPDGQHRVLGALTIDVVLAEMNDLIAWRVVPDGPPTRFDLSIDEWTAVTAIVDATREEQLRAVMERREPNVQSVTHDAAARQIVSGLEKPDRHWLISVLAHFSPPNCVPNTAALDRGATALIRRGWAKTGKGSLELRDELQAVCLGFANLAPFLSLSVGAPWAEPKQSLFIHGVTGIWSIEFRPDADGGPHVSVARLGARATDDVLRKHLGALWSVAVDPPARPTPVAAPPAPAPVKQVAAAAPRAAAPVAAPQPSQPRPSVETRPCPNCGAALRGDAKFCIKCGKPVTAAPSAGVAAPAGTVCPNPRCGKPLKPGAKFCMACGTKLAPKPN